MENQKNSTYPSCADFDYRKSALNNEEKILFKRAAFSKNHERRNGREDDHRLPYKRDVDRIIHSKAYTRYVDKTQVVYLVKNDHISHRGLHVQLVSNFSRGIAEILRLNLDLVEAISLGHDVGHPPFGHEGEEYLSELSLEHGEGIFAHPWQSCRLLSLIEPLNLGFAVYDGFLCHDGGLREERLKPSFEKGWDEHFSEMQSKRTDPNLQLMPSTLEGCLVKLCDTMSYIGRDIEDAIHLGIIKRAEVPHTILGTTNGEILSVLAQDIIKHSYDQEYIAISKESKEALNVLREFNFKNIYFHPKLKVESKKIKRSYQILFDLLLDDYDKNDSQSYLWLNFLSNKSEKYLKNLSKPRAVIDYISGMTDSFFVKTLEQFLIPKLISFD